MRKRRILVALMVFCIKLIETNCESISMFTADTDYNMQNAVTIGFIQRQASNNCDFTSVSGSSMYGGLNCFVQNTVLNYYGPFDSTGNFFQLQPHYQVTVSFKISFFFPLNPTSQVAQVQINVEQNTYIQTFSGSNCSSLQDPANSNYPYVVCVFSQTYAHQFDSLSLQIIGSPASSSYSWGVQQITFATTQCAASCQICSSSSCLQNSPINLTTQTQYQSYYYERELYEPRVENTLIINKYCLVSSFIFLNSGFYPFVGLSSSSDATLISPQTILFELQNLPAHFSIYVQFKLIQALCGTTITIMLDEAVIPFQQVQQSPCTIIPAVSYVYFSKSLHTATEASISIQQTGSSFGIRELKVYFDLCLSSCTLCSNGTVCDTDNGVQSVANFLYQINSANLIREDWIVLGSLSNSYVSTCNNMQYFGGIGIFDWKTKVQNYFHITQPHYSAKIQIQFIKMTTWGTNKIVIIVDGKVFRYVSFCDCNRTVCSTSSASGGDQIKQVSFEFPHFAYDFSVSIQPDIQSNPGTSLSWAIANFNLSVRKCNSACTSGYCTGPLVTDCGLPSTSLVEIRSFFSFVPPVPAETAWAVTNKLSTCGSSIYNSCSTGVTQFYGGSNCFDATTSLSRSYQINDSFAIMVIQFNFIKIANWQTEGQILVSVNNAVIYKEILSSTQGSSSCYVASSNDIIIYPVKIELIQNSVAQTSFAVQIQATGHSGQWAIQQFQLSIYGCPLGQYFSSNTCTNCSSSSCLACTTATQCFSQCFQSCLTCYGESQYECLSCDASLNRVLAGSVCKCNTGYFEIGQPACSQCHQTCMQCTGVAINQCSFCDKNLYRQLDSTTNMCICVERFYENPPSLQCQRCHFSCLTCNGVLNSNCLSCSSTADKRVFDPTTGECICQDGYYEDTTLSKCLPCQLKCATCVTSPSNCLTCAVNRVIPPTCECPTLNQVWLDGEACNPCNTTCQQCFGFNSNECSSCTGSLYLSNFQCIGLCPFFEYFGDLQNSYNVCLKRCPNSQYQIKKRLCCLNTSEPCFNEITNSISYFSASDNLPNNVKLKFSSPVRVDYMQGYERVILLSMENISSFVSSITPMDESGGYVQTFNIQAVPQQSVIYSILTINLLADYIRDVNGIPQSKAGAQVTAKFGKTEFIPADQVDAIESASAKAKATSQVISIMGAALYFLNVCQLLDIVVDVMQWSYYYTFINIDYPINADLFFSTFNNINLNIKIFNIQISSSGDKKVLGADLVNQTAPQKFTDHNLTSSFMINGVSFMMTLAGFVIGRYLLVSIHDCYNETEDDHKYSIICQALKFVKNLLSFAPIIKFIQSSFFGIMFSACLQLRNIDTSNGFNVGSLLLCIGTLILFLIAIGYFMLKVNKCAAEPKYVERFGCLFEFYKQDSFITRNFAFWIFIKKVLMMSSLVLLYDKLYVNLIFIGSVCLLFSIFIYFSKPYTLTRMNDFHIFSEFLLIICLVLIYEIEDCNIQINNQGDQGIDQNLIDKKLFLGWWLIIITIAHIVIIVAAISGLLWFNIKQQFGIYMKQLKNICNLCYANFLNRIQFYYRSIMIYYFEKPEKIWLPKILDQMKKYHVYYMSCTEKGRWKSKSTIMLTEHEAIRQVQNAVQKFQFGEFIFFLQPSKNKKEMRAWVWSESYQMQLHNQAESYLKDKLDISKKYARRYENNSLYKQIFKQLVMYSSNFDRKVNPTNLLDQYSEQHFSELYNVITFRNYWNFIKDEVDLHSFIRNDEISEIYFGSHKQNQDSQEAKQDDELEHNNENEQFKNLTISLETKYSEKIPVKRCECQYCQGLFYAKEYLEKIDWKVFYHFKENYIQMDDVLNMLNKMEEKMILLLKDILHERVQIMETGIIISPEDIENTQPEEINDPKYNCLIPEESTIHTNMDILDSSITQTKKQLKKKLIEGPQLEMVNINRKSQKKESVLAKTKIGLTDKKKQQQQKGNKKLYNKDKLKNLYNIFDDPSDSDEEEEEEVEEPIIIEKYVRFKIFKWVEE